MNIHSIQKIWLLGLASVWACSSDTANPTTADAGSPADAATDTVPVDPKCLAFEAALQDALDKERVKQKVKSAALGVWTAECYKTFVHSSDDPAKLTASSQWRIGSVTKTFVAITALNLIAEGKFALDDSIAKWLPFVPSADVITVRELLNHTSGLHNYTATAAFAALDLSQAKTPEELLRMAVAEAPTNAPGAAFNYSNTNYVALGMILEKVTGEGLPALLKKYAIDKAGLKHTVFDVAGTALPDLVPGFTGAKDVSFMIHPSIAWAAGSMVSTTRDVVDWILAAYRNKTLTTPAMTEEMFKTKSGYGLGMVELSARNTNGMGLARGHDGKIDGYVTMALSFEKNAAVVGVIANTAGDPNELLLITLDAIQAMRAN